MRTLLAAAAVATLPFAAPSAQAVPPLIVSGSGTITPGLILPCCVYPVFISFSGTGTDGVFTYACTFQGSGTNVPPGGATGSLEGYCGPFTYTGCVFSLSPTTWNIACPTSVGVFSVSYVNVQPTTAFTATGVMS